MFLVVNWVGGKDNGGQRTVPNDRVKDPQNKVVPEPGHNQMENQNKPVQTSLHQRQASDSANSNRTKQPKKSKSHQKDISKTTAPKVVMGETTQSQPATNQIPEWEAQQKEENREFRARRKQRAKKCFPFSICA